MNTISNTLLWKVPLALVLVLSFELQAILAWDQ